VAFDALIRNGRVVDGTGGPWFVADVALHRGLVAAVGRLDGARAALELDATGKTVAPGFVDIHEQSDWTLLADPRASSAIRQGVTTVVPGNCGFSAAPLVDLSAQRGGLYGYVEGLTVDWRTFGEYLDRLRAARPAVNVAPLVGHGALRSAVMGFAPRPPQEGEQGAMRALLEEALEAGAFGLSAGLEYAPGQNAAPDELVDLLGPVRAGGRLFAVHIRSRDYHYLPAVEEALQVARRAGVATQLSHLTARYGALRDADRAVWRLLDEARDGGLDVTCDQHPFTTSNGAATTVLPPWAFEGGREALAGRLRDPQTRARLKEFRGPQNKLIVAGQWQLISLVAAPQRPDLLGRPLHQLAAERGGDPYDAIFDAMLAALEAGDDPTAVRLRAEHYVDEEVLRDALTHPLYMFESDGQVLAPDGPLGAVRNPYSYGWVARFLGTYARDRGWLTLEDAVRRLTSFPARKLGLGDRGLLRPGMRADLVVFDAATLRPQDTALDPSRFPSGVSDVFVNGVPAVREGVATGARPGHVLRPT
jgi:N-acyl-D-aspartate/D-glutamate deacylase